MKGLLPNRYGNCLLENPILLEEGRPGGRAGKCRSSECASAQWRFVGLVAERCKVRLFTSDYCGKAEGISFAVTA